MKITHQTTLGELLSHENETIRRQVIGIMKQSMKLEKEKQKEKK